MSGIRDCTAMKKKSPHGSNLNFGAVREHKGSSMAKGGVAVGVNTEVPCCDGNDGTVGWQDALKMLTRGTHK